MEQSYEEATTRINELTVINVNLSSSKAKIEQELACVAADYDEITKELRVADERYQRVQVSWVLIEDLGCGICDRYSKKKELFEKIPEIDFGDIII